MPVALPASDKRNRRVTVRQKYIRDRLLWKGCWGKNWVGADRFPANFATQKQMTNYRRNEHWQRSREQRHNHLSKGRGTGSDDLNSDTKITIYCWQSDRSDGGNDGNIRESDDNNNDKNYWSKSDTCVDRKKKKSMIRLVTDRGGDRRGIGGCRVTCAAVAATIATRPPRKLCMWGVTEEGR